MRVPPSSADKLQPAAESDLTLGNAESRESPGRSASGALPLVVIDTRIASGHGLFLQTLASGAIYRLDAARFPGQPRLWCFRIFRCTSVRIPIRGELPWYGGGPMTREELAPALSAIRDDPNGWLTSPPCAALRDWIAEVIVNDAGLPGALSSKSFGSGTRYGGSNGNHLTRPKTVG
jgi:hypothetical protein